MSCSPFKCEVYLKKEFVELYKTNELSVHRLSLNQYGRFSVFLFINEITTACGIFNYKKIIIYSVKMKVGIYACVSTQNQQTLPLQIKNLRENAEKRKC